MPECEVETSLAVSVDLNCISPELSRLAITKTSLMSPPLSLPKATTVTNKAVSDLETYLTSQGLSKKTPRKWLLQSITFEAAQYALDVVHRTYTKLNKNKRRNPEALETFLSSEFSAPQNKPKSSVNEPPPLSEVRHSSNQSALSSQAEVLGNLCFIT